MAGIEAAPSDFTRASGVPSEGNASNASTAPSDASTIADNSTAPGEMSDIDAASSPLEAKDSVSLPNDAD